MKLSALVIGNAHYATAGKLKNSKNDGEDFAGKLNSSGFTVATVLDGTFKEMDVALSTFRKEAKDSDVAIFFFAGHGVQIDDGNYLMAIDTSVEDELEAKHSSLSLNKVIEALERAKTSTNIIILDACRNNPWERAWRGKLRGLAPVYAPKGTLIAFSTSPGQLADDGKGRNGAYTAALLQHIDAQDVTIEAMFKRVRNTLGASTNQKQISWEHTSLAGEFYFNLGVAARITEYGASAIKDRTFVLDEGKFSHLVIKGLKSSTWPRQNPAVVSFTAAKASKASNDSLFVVGRNICQAADGSANNAVYYIDQFMEKTSGLEPIKRKAILDGILFEIFFDSDGKIRDQPKDYHFERVFSLQKYAELSDSFEFIASCLAPHAERYHSIPGKAHKVSVDVTLRDDPENAVSEIYLGGKNILFADDPDYDLTDIAYRTQARIAFESRLAKEMLVSSHLLTITYSKPTKRVSEVLYPYGHTVRKPLA